MRRPGLYPPARPVHPAEVNNPVPARRPARIRLPDAAVAALAFVSIFSLHAAPRVWTDLDGRTVEAELVRADSASVVIRRAADGREFTLPRDRLSPADLAFLSELPASPPASSPGASPSSSLDALNRALNLPLFAPTPAASTLWDEPPAALAARLKLRPESITPGAETWRIYPRPPHPVLGAPAYMLALRSETGRPTEFTLMFTNQGDHPAFARADGARFVSPSAIKTFESDLARDFQTVRENLSAALPPSAALEATPALRRAYPGELALFAAERHFLLLHARPGNLLALRVLPAVETSASRLSDDQLRQRLRSLVTRRDNGDVVLDRIPMVDQGPKGYCVPATFERVLLYSGIPADLYDLAALGGTAHGGGTHVPSMIDGLERTVRQAGRRLEKISVKQLTPATLARYIDEGRPVLWSLSSTPDFNQAADTYTKARATLPPHAPGELAAFAREQRRVGADLAPDPDYGHVCLLIGYNRATGELAFSDSWGPQFAERWLPASAVDAVSRGELWVLNF